MNEGTGYYWDTKRESPLGGRWQWRVGVNVGGADSAEDAKRDLRIMGAVEEIDVTSEGRASEFGHNEAGES